jgi:hypothetical protein
MKNFTRSITDALSQTTDTIETASAKLLPAGDSDKAYWLGDKVGAWTDFIPDDLPGWGSPSEVSEWFKETMQEQLGLHRMERSTRMVRPGNIAQQVTILPTAEGVPEKRNIFAMLEEDAFESIANAEPIFGSRQTLTSPYEQSEGKGELLNTTPILAPFSKYTPTILWPFTTEEGTRYTVHDLGEEEISFPGKPFVEYALGKELDQVGALPGFPIWGDSLLGAGPILVGGSAAALLFFTSWAWGPAIVNTGRSLVTKTVFGVKEIAVATKDGLTNIGKAFV